MKNLLILIFLFPIITLGQNYKLLSSIDLEIAGTSTLHDWEMVSEKGYGSAELLINEGELLDIKSLSFALKTESLKSGRTTMDKICYESMKTKTHNQISFVLKDVISILEFGEEYKIKARGDMKISGVTRSVVLSVTGRHHDGTFEFFGKYDLKMTDYNIDPPTAIFGTIKTGNEITISFDVRFEPKPLT